MEFFDLLEQHGVELDTQDKEKRYKNILSNALILLNNLEWSPEDVLELCNKLTAQYQSLKKLDGLGRKNSRGLNVPRVIDYFLHEESLFLSFGEYLSRLSIIIEFIKDDKVKVVEFIDTVIKGLEQCKLPYCYYDGMIVPLGAKTLDDGLIGNVLIWLKNYPTAYQVYKIAIQQYFDAEEFSVTADSLRKSLEFFLHEYLNNSKNLENNISEIGKYLKSQNVSDDIREMFTTLMRHYKTNNDKTAKHHAETEKKVIEFLLYQTGVFIRLLIQIKQAENRGDTLCPTK